MYINKTPKLPLNADEIIDALNDKELFKLKDALMKISAKFFKKTEKENRAADNSKNTSGNITYRHE
jgi:hypothetical protein